MKVAKIYIMGLIGGGGYNSAYLAQYMDYLRESQNPDRFVIFINSPGGDYFESLAMYDFISSQDNVDIVITGHAFSAAAILSMAAKKISISENAFVMVHHPWSESSGPMNYRDAQGLADDLKKVGERQIQILAARTGKSETEIDDFLTQDKRLSAQEALALKLVDEIVPAALVNRQTLAFVQYVYGYNNNDSEERTMTIEELKAELGLPATATDEEVKAKVAELKALDTPPAAPAAPAESENPVEARLKALEDQHQKDVQAATQAKATALVDGAIGKFKIQAAHRDAYVAQALSDFDGVKAKLDGIPENSVKPGKVVPGTPGASDDPVEEFRAEITRQATAKNLAVPQSIPR